MADKQVCFSAPDEPPLGRTLVLTLLKKINKKEALNKPNTSLSAIGFSTPKQL